MLERCPKRNRKYSELIPFYFVKKCWMKTILSKLVTIFGKFHMFNLIWLFCFMVSRELVCKTDNNFHNRMKTVKNKNKNVYFCKTLRLCIASKKYHSFNYSPFITQFVPFHKHISWYCVVTIYS